MVSVLLFNSLFEVFAGGRLKAPWHQAGGTVGWGLL